MSAKKYVSIIKKGVNDIYIKDAEGRALTQSIIDTMVINEQTGDVTITYDDGTEDEEESES